MPPHVRGHHPKVKRQPLKEIDNASNTMPSRSDVAMSTTSGTKTPTRPHDELGNELPELDGRSAGVAMDEKVMEDNRIAEAVVDHERNSKRHSGVSATSTNASGRRRKAYIGHWQLGKTIGKGGCSRVRVVRHRFKDQYGAVKIITRSTAESTRAQSLANLSETIKPNAIHPAGFKPIPFGLEREIAIMRLLEHRNIVRLFDVWENSNELYLIMEYADGGELFHYVDQRKGLPEIETVYIFRQIVSALLYCHRLRICHRDLKPENILLNQRDLTVKLIDFGMAALQPEGRLLSTPCGSPHYAAPEVVSGRPYDGTLADAWSCGVILYVMLTGTAPYNYAEDGDIRALFRDIARARYYMPPELSLEAKDLLQRIFVPDPRARLSMDDIWEHALMHKFDTQFGCEGQAGSKEAAIGPIPTIEDWKVQHAQDIDHEILRNMRTLWHSETEQSLIQKLLNNDYNQEKLFYAALLKHREEHLENYVGEAEIMDYSTSDYHHSRPMHASTSTIQPKKVRSHSQYSILNDEHLRPSDSFVEPPPSIGSYDPYRSPQNPLPNGKADYVSVTVHHQHKSPRRRGVSQKGRSLRHPNPLRIETLKQDSKRTSARSVASLPPSIKSRASIQRSSASKQSMTSTTWPSSPPVLLAMRPSANHKRGVSFNHLRRRSATVVAPGQSVDKVHAPNTPVSINTTDVAVISRAISAATSQSPREVTAQAVLSRKERVLKAEPLHYHVANEHTSGTNIRTEIRKHSAELEKVCEEAFFRSSMASNASAKTPPAENKSAYQTPPSSVSAFPRADDSKQSQSSMPPQRNISLETPKTYLSRTLEETREKLAAYQSFDQSNAAGYDEIMRLLDSFVQPSIATHRQEAHNFSAPQSRTPEARVQLPKISEESVLRQSQDFITPRNNKRSVTAPTRTHNFPADRTVRMVASSSSPSPVFINKARNRSHFSALDKQVLRDDSPNGSPTNTMTHSRSSLRATSLPVIAEDPPIIVQEVLRKKRSGWFGLGKKDSVEKETLTAKIKFQDTNGRTEDRAKSRAAVPPTQVGDIDSHAKKQFITKKSFAKWLGRKLVSDALQIEPTVTEAESLNANSLSDTSQNTAVETSRRRYMESMFSSSSPQLGNEEKIAESGQGRSWFARFFHIKPVTKVICFSIPRTRARQELVILLKEWQRHGIRDLQFYRETHSITARVDRENALNIKPVSFRIELFVVLEHGRKVGLSIARIVQVKGAASGFRKVVEVIDGVMRGNGWLVEDEEKRRALSEVVDV